MSNEVDENRVNRYGASRMRGNRVLCPGAEQTNMFCHDLETRDRPLGLFAKHVRATSVDEATAGVVDAEALAPAGLFLLGMATIAALRLPEGGDLCVDISALGVPWADKHVIYVVRLIGGEGKTRFAVLSDGPAGDLVQWQFELVGRVLTNAYTDPH